MDALHYRHCRDSDCRRHSGSPISFEHRPRARAGGTGSAPDGCCRGGARAIGREHEFGAVAPGLSADLLILNADPLRDIGNVRDFDALVLRGRVVERQALSYKAFMAEERTGTQ